MAESMVGFPVINPLPARSGEKNKQLNMETKFMSLFLITVCREGSRKCLSVCLLSLSNHCVAAVSQQRLRRRHNTVTWPPAMIFGVNALPVKRHGLHHAAVSHRQPGRETRVLIESRTTPGCLTRCSTLCHRCF